MRTRRRGGGTNIHDGTTDAEPVCEGAYSSAQRGQLTEACAPQVGLARPGKTQQHHRAVEGMGNHGDDVAGSSK